MFFFNLTHTILSLRISCGKCVAFVSTAMLRSSCHLFTLFCQCMERAQTCDEMTNALIRFSRFNRVSRLNGEQLLATLMQHQPMWFVVFVTNDFNGFFSCFLMFRECDTRIMNEIPFVLFVLFFICGDFYWNNLHRIDLLLRVKQNRVQHSIWWTMELPATNHLCTGAANRKYLN